MTDTVGHIVSHHRTSFVFLVFAVLPICFSTHGWAGEKERRLYEAASKGNISVLKEMIAVGADVNSFNSGTGVPLSPLLAAASANYLEGVEILLKAGADPNLSSNNDGCAALCMARNRDTRIVATLLAHGANPNARTEKFSYTPLGDAASCNIKTLTKLKKEGGFRGPFPDCAETVRLLIRAGADVNVYDSFGDTPLIRAVRSNSIDTLKALLEEGADPNKKWYGENVTPLMIALDTYLQHRDVSTIRQLLLHGADSNARNDRPFDEYEDHRRFPNWDGYTLLGFAARYGLSGVAELLLSHGADPTARRTDGVLVSDVARQNGHVKTAVLIERHIKGQPTRR